ncbi:YbhB/YbcL family Raf kinase inhibitor-like protein [Bradyrhizobium sp. CB82]|uniref:YbhB/YbcL family Raf kinase inhibitor-like protein n=1 Tax=Bradyrhizobium sp. CB82 TaxID=3039159 RepID=UPI0024B08CEA|nr:YbhB/YbcL family Raf kinase inhibitor-like protein [Bradyrhizobium sp. CB82]WFU43357.1 YbhB/YbcL family Raf kinase inhibitor-like protein [Bradyrhizobium sp. CB82]
MSKRGWILAVALTALFGTRGALAADGFVLSSSTFKDGEPLPQKSAGNNKSNPNCVGENVSPELTISNAPVGTKSFALLIFDPEGRPPGGVNHFVAYGIPASVTSFPEGELSKPSDKFVGGQSTMKLPTYFGPCTPAGAPHHYIFTLIATDLDAKDLKEGMTRDELIKALDGHAKGATGLIATFSHP